MLRYAGKSDEEIENLLPSQNNLATQGAKYLLDQNQAFKAVTDDAYR